MCPYFSPTSRETRTKQLLFDPISIRYIYPYISPHHQGRRVPNNYYSTLFILDIFTPTPAPISRKTHSKQLLFDPISIRYIYPCISPTIKGDTWNNHYSILFILDLFTPTPPINFAERHVHTYQYITIVTYETVIRRSYFY